MDEGKGLLIALGTKPPEPRKDERKEMMQGASRALMKAIKDDDANAVSEIIGDMLALSRLDED